VLHCNERQACLVQDYWRFYLATVAFIIFFGGLLAPILEVKLGVGGACRYKCHHSTVQLICVLQSL
jgi:hypothetical protein